MALRNDVLPTLVPDSANNTIFTPSPTLTIATNNVSTL